MAIQSDKFESEKSMIPIPDYLKQYALEQTQKDNCLSFKLRCLCGCERFNVWEKDYTNKENELIKEYKENIPDTGWHTIYGGVDSNGKPYNYIKILGIFKKQITFPKTPVFMEVDVVKAICSQCQKEIVIFDSRYYGYDGMTSNNEEIKKYIPHFKQRDNKLYGIKVSIQNVPSLEAFKEVWNGHCSFEFYSNSFSWICIQGVDENGKQKVLYDFETA